jgi:4-hydroxybenzoate polyprenyltransferase
MTSDRREYVSGIGPRLRVLSIILIILIIPFVLMLFLGEVWISGVGLFLLYIALSIIRFYSTRKKHRIYMGTED